MVMRFNRHPTTVGLSLQSGLHAMTMNSELRLYRQATEFVLMRSIYSAAR